MTIIELNLLNLNKKEINVKGFIDKKGFIHKPHKRNIKDIPKNEEEKKFLMIPKNVEKILTSSELGISGVTHKKETYIIKFKNNFNAIYKTMKKKEIIGEVTTYDISKKLNWNIVPETVENDFGKGNGSCQKMIDGVEPYSGYDDKDNYIKINKNHFDDLSKIFVLDMITGNYDRHDANVIIDKNNKCWAIDNEDFGNPDTAKEFIKVLDSMCGLSSESDYNPMIVWLKKNLDKNDFLEFRKYILKNIKEVIDNEDKISKLLHSKDLDLSIILNIINNIEFMKTIK